MTLAEDHYLPEPTTREDQVTNPPVPLDTDDISIARLPGQACFHCGAVAKSLYAAGYITLPGRDRVWPVVACESCRHRRRS